MSRLAAAINQTLREGVGREREMRSRHFGIRMEQNRYDQSRSDRMASEQAAGDRWQRTHDAEQQRWEKGYQQDEREFEATTEDALFRRGMLEKDFNRQVGMDMYTRYQDKVASRYQRERDTADDQYRDIEQSTKADQFAATQVLEKQKMIMTREQNRISNKIAREAQQSIDAYRNDQSALGWSEAERRGTSNMLDREIKKKELESDAMYRRRILEQGDRGLGIREEANEIARIRAGEGNDAASIPSVAGMKIAEELGESLVREFTDKGSKWTLNAVGAHKDIGSGYWKRQWGRLPFRGPVVNPWVDPKGGPSQKTDLMKIGELAAEELMTRFGGDASQTMLHISTGFNAMLRDETYGAQMLTRLLRKHPGGHTRLEIRGVARDAMLEGARNYIRYGSWQGPAENDNMQQRTGAHDLKSMPLE